MDWSATLSLTTSHTRTHRGNYGSFSAADAAPLKRHGSGSTISIPESIPEHQCVERFASPHLNYAAVLERFDVLGIASAAASISSAVSSASGGYASISSSKTLTITETASADVTRLQTFKMLLTSPSYQRINGGPPASAASEDPFAPHDAHDPHDGASAGVASSYWLQERERMRLLRDKRHRARNGSPTKAATLRDDDDPEVSKYRTAALMCSVPLLLVIAFVVFALVFGDGSAAVAAEASGVAVLAASNAAAAAPAAPSSHLRTGGGQPPPALAQPRNP